MRYKSCTSIIIAMFILIISSTVAAFADQPQMTASDLKWTEKGEASFKVSGASEDSFYCRLDIYKNGNRIQTTTSKTNAPWFSTKESNQFLINIVYLGAIEDTGEYQFSVGLGSSREDAMNSTASEKSGKFYYSTADKTTLDSPTNLIWDTDKCMLSWDKVRNADIYQIEGFYDGNRDPYACVSGVDEKNLNFSIENDVCIYDLSSRVSSSENNNPEKYAFRVLARNTDLSTYSMSAYSELVGPTTNMVSIVATGNCGAEGDNLKWVLKDDGTLTISGSGDMEDYGVQDESAAPWIMKKGEDGKWYRYSSPVKRVRIDEGITSIGTSAFLGCTELSDIILPRSITKVGKGAFKESGLHTAGPVGKDYDIQFYGNNSIEKDIIHNGDVLTLFEFPQGRKTIERNLFTCGNVTDYSFTGCDHCPETVILPDGLETIEKKSFLYCTNLKKIVIPESVSNMGKGIFEHCDQLRTAGPMGGDYNIEFGWTESIPDNAFCYQSINEVGNCALSSVTFPKSLKKIGFNAFFGCDQITQIDLPSSLSTLGLGSFSYCANLNKIKIISDVIVPYTGDSYDGVFCGCGKLKTIGPIGGNYNIEIGFKEKIPTLLFGRMDSLLSATVPEGIRIIERHAFIGCSNLTKVIIPDSVNSTGQNGSGSPFFGCDKLKTVGPIGSSCNIQVAWKHFVPEYMFSNCNSITSVTIPEGIEAIGNGAFFDCASLEKLVIPDSAKYFCCQGYYDEDTNQYSYVDISNGKSIEKCPKLKTAGKIGSGCNIEFGWTNAIPEYAFRGIDSIERITLPEGVTKIERNAFYKCTNLEKIILPESAVEFRYKNAIYECENLETAGPIGGDYNLEYGWTQKIPQYAFYGSNLKWVKIPKTIHTIGQYSFADCSELTDVYYDGTKISWQSIDKTKGNDILQNVVIHCSDGTINGESSYSGILKEGEGWIIKWEITYTESSPGVRENPKLKIKGSGNFNGETGVFLNSEIDDGNTMPWLSEEYGFGKNDFISLDINGPFYVIPNQFEGYTNLQYVYMEGVSDIGGEAFTNCSSLLSVILNDKSLISISAKAFKGDRKLTAFGSNKDNTLASLKHIGNEAFADTSLQMIEIQDSLETVGQYAFKNSQIERIHLGKKVKSIGDNAFSGVTKPKIYCYKNSYAHQYAEDNSILYYLYDGFIIRTEGYDMNLYDVIGERSFEDYLATRKSTEYDSKLAYILAGLSSAAYDFQKNWETFRNLGFSKNDITYDHYNDTDPFAAYMVGKKELEDGSTLVLVDIRGTSGGFGMEAVFGDGNLGLPAILATGKHYGFYQSAKSVIKGIEKLCNGIPTSNVTYVITGHSLGGGTGNLLAVELSDRGVPKSKVFDYNFACPDVARHANVDWNPGGIHDNIFNISDARDPVSYVPGLAVDLITIPLTNIAFQWGKYGHSYWYSFDWSSLDKVNLDFSVHNMHSVLEYMSLYKTNFKSWIEVEAVRPIDQWSVIHSIRCPVDVRIQDKQRKTVASVINNKADYNGKSFSDLMIFVCGDEKYLCLPTEKEYSVILTGTDDGEMNYNILKADLNTRTVETERIYSSVALENGKKMQIDLPVSPDVQKAKLYVIDDNNSPVAEIQQNGEEKSLFPLPIDTFTLSANNNELTVAWDKIIENVDGCQLQYATNIAFGDAKTISIDDKTITSYTISSGLRTGKYFVRIRSYLNVDNNKKYSDWSDIKEITVNIESESGESGSEGGGSGGSGGGGAAQPEATEADKAAAAAVVSAIDKIPEVVSIDAVDVISVARTEYDKLTDAQKALVDPAAVESLKKAEKAIADKLTENIIALPDAVNLDDETAVTKIRNVYDALTAYQKTLLDNDVVQKLQRAESSISAWKEFNAAADIVSKSKLASFKVKAKRGRRALATWNANKKVSGYEIQYSTSRKFKKAKKKYVKRASAKKLTIKRLKKGRVYYFRARTYTKVYNAATGKTSKIYGKWIKIRRIKAIG